MISKLNQKLINIDNESILTKQDTTFYFETSFNSSEKEIPEIVKFNSNTPLTNDELEALGTCYVIPYTSIVYIKDSQRFWTHGQIYDGKPSVVHNVSSSSQSFTVNGTTYTLSKEGNDFAITSFTAPTLTLQFIATSESGSNVSTFYDGQEHTATKTATPSNKIQYKLSKGSVSSITITEITVVNGSDTKTITDSNYLKTLDTNKTSWTDLFTLPDEAKAPAATATATGTLSASKQASTVKQTITIKFKDSNNNTYSQSATVAAKTVTATVTLKKRIIYGASNFDSKPTTSNLVGNGYSPSTIPTVTYTCGASDCWLGFPTSWGKPKFVYSLGEDGSWLTNTYTITVANQEYTCYWHASAGADFAWTITFSKNGNNPQTF